MVDPFPPQFYPLNQFLHIYQLHLRHNLCPPNQCPHQYSFHLDHNLNPPHPSPNNPPLPGMRLFPRPHQLGKQAREQRKPLSAPRAAMSLMRRSSSASSVETHYIPGRRKRKNCEINQRRPTSQKALISFKPAAQPPQEAPRKQFGQPQMPQQYTQTPPPSPAPLSIPSQSDGTWICPQCGNRGENNFRFCMNCGFRRES